MPKLLLGLMGGPKAKEKSEPEYSPYQVKRAAVRALMQALSSEDEEGVLEALELLGVGSHNSHNDDDY